MMTGDSEWATKKDLEAFATKKDLEVYAANAKKDLEHAFIVLSDNIRAVGVSVERVESHVRGLAEALTSTREQLERKIDGVEERLSARIAVLEEVVRKNSEDIRRNSEDIQLLQTEVAGMRLQLARREKLDDLDARVTTIEKRLGVSAGK
jgi:predicted  nucleic acid-binding Zn-ribbon protein